MNIPRFEAQVSQIQVPTIKNYQEEENATIAKALSDFGSSLLGISAKVYAGQQIQNKKQMQELFEERRTLIKNNADTEHVDEMLRSLGAKI